MRRSQIPAKPLARISNIDICFIPQAYVDGSMNSSTRENLEYLCQNVLLVSRGIVPYFSVWATACDHGLIKIHDASIRLSAIYFVYASHTAFHPQISLFFILYAFLITLPFSPCSSENICFKGRVDIATQFARPGGSSHRCTLVLQVSTSWSLGGRCCSL